MIFFFNDTATTEIYTLSLHDALPIWAKSRNINSLGSVEPPSTSVEEHHALSSAELASPLQLYGTRQSRSAFGRSIDAFRRLQLICRGQQGFVADGDGAAFAVAQRAQHQPISERRRYPQAGGHGFRVGARCRPLGARFERLHDGCATGRLYRVHPRQRTTYPAAVP